MEFIRITLAGFMALLVSMPFGVCGEACHDGFCYIDACHVEMSACEDSCCSDRQVLQQQAKACGCNCLGECHTLHFEQRDYAMLHSEASAPEATEQPAAFHDLPYREVLTGQRVHGGVHLRAPPDGFVRSSRQIIHCVFRW